MQRRFNYTERVRILQEDVRFSLRQANGKWSFDASIALAEYELPENSLVFVEAYRQTVWMRFAWGTVGSANAPADRTLSEFESPEDILFRIRVTSPGTSEEPHGLLLAEADRIRLRGPEETDDSGDPLLPVVPFDLGDELWRIDFSEKPRLLLNRQAGDYKQIGQHPAFVALTYPAAMREILTYILLVLGHRDYDDINDPHSRWLRFAVQVLGMDEPPIEEDGEEAARRWVGEAVTTFTRKHGLLERFQGFWLREEAQ